MDDKLKRIERRLGEIALTFGTASVEYNTQKAAVEQYMDKISNNNPNLGALWFLDVESKRIRFNKKALRTAYSAIATDIDSALDDILQVQNNQGTAYSQALKYNKDGVALLNSRDLKNKRQAIQDKAYIESLAKNNSVDYYLLMKSLPEGDVKDAIESDWDLMNQIKYRKGSPEETDERESRFDYLVEGIVKAMAGVQYESFRKHKETAIGNPTTIGEISGMMEY